MSHRLSPRSARASAMFGSCRAAGRDRSDSYKDKEEKGNPGHPLRYEGQRREIVVKQAGRVSTHVLSANMTEIEKELSDEEREYETRAARLEESRKQKQHETKDAAIGNAIAGAGAQLRGNSVDKTKGLVELQKAAELALKTELERLDSSVHVPGDGGGSTKPDPDDGVTTPMPQSPMVLVKVTQPCLVSLLRTKLQKMLDIPPDHVRVVHRGRTLKDEGFVPMDTVDLGEQDAVDGDEAEEDRPDLEYLWVVDTRTLQSPCEDSRKEDPRDDVVDKREGQATAAAAAVQGKANSEGVNTDERAPECDHEQQRRKGGGKAAVGTRVNEEVPTISPSEGDVAKEKNGAAPQSAVEFEIETARSSETVAPASSAVAGPEKVPIRESQEGKRRVSGAPDEGIKRRKRKLVPGNLLLKSVSASGLSADDDDGVFSKQSPYLVVKWAEQEARTTAARNSATGRDCSLPEEVLVLLVRSKKQLHEPMRVELWNHNGGDEEPQSEHMIGRGNLSVKHLAQSDAEAPAVVDTEQMRGFNAGTEEAKRMSGTELTVSLEPGDEWKWTENVSGVTVTMTLAYTPPRRKSPRASRNKKEEKETAGEAVGTATNSNTNTDKTDPLSSFAGICVGSSLGNPDGVSAQELEALISQKLEGFDIQEELTKIGCQRYAQGLIHEGFGQRGAFANIQEKHMAGHPIYMPRGERKRVMTLAELVRLQMKSEESKDGTIMEALKEEGALVAAQYTVDGETFFDTRVRLKASLLEDGRSGMNKSGGAFDDEEVIRAIEVAAAKKEQGIFRLSHAPNAVTSGHCDSRSRVRCCEKHASMIQKSTLQRVGHHVRETSKKVDAWLEQADRFNNGVVLSDPTAVHALIRDTMVSSGLPSPRESDVRMFLERIIVRDSLQDPRIDRQKLGLEMEELIRRELSSSRPCVSHTLPLD